MARSFNGTNQSITLSPGAFSGFPFTFGTIAFIVRWNGTNGYQEAYSSSTSTYAGVTDSEHWGMAPDNGGTGLSIAVSTATWYCVICTKATGSAVTRVNVYNYTTTSWLTPADSNGTAANGSANVTNHYLGSFTGGNEWWNGDIAAAGVFRGWVPNDGAAQAAGLESAAANWVTAAGSADKASVWILNQASAATQIVDSTGGGATETTSGVGTVVAGPAGFDDGSPPPPIVPTLVQTVDAVITNTAATTTVSSFAGATKPAVGDMVVVYGARDNITNDPATGDTFTDTDGNTWLRPLALAQPTGTSTALAGVVGVMFYTIVTTAWSAGTNTLTWTHPSTKAAMRIEHWQHVGHIRPDGVSSNGNAAGAPSVIESAGLTGDLALGMEAIEYSTAGTSTADGDTTNGAWSAVQGPTATTGTTLAACKVISQYKTLTASGSQTFNPTHSVTASVDTVAILAVFAPPFKRAPVRRHFMPAVQRAATF